MLRACVRVLGAWRRRRQRSCPVAPLCAAIRWAMMHDDVRPQSAHCCRANSTTAAPRAAEKRVEERTQREKQAAPPPLPRLAAWNHERGRRGSVGEGKRDATQRGDPHRCGQQSSTSTSPKYKKPPASRLGAGRPPIMMARSVQAVPGGSAEGGREGAHQPAYVWPARRFQSCETAEQHKAEKINRGAHGALDGTASRPMTSMMICVIARRMTRS